MHTQSNRTYGRVLLPVDGSEGTDRVVEQLLDHGFARDSTLHVLYAIDPALLSTDVGDFGTGPESIRSVVPPEELEERAEQIVDEIVQKAERAGDVSGTGTVTFAEPHRAILEYASENDIDLIVMGTHGRTGLDRYLIGSVTEKVVRHSDVPVLTVRMTDGTEPVDA